MHGSAETLIGVQHVFNFCIIYQVIRKKGQVLLPDQHTYPSETMTDR